MRKNFEKANKPNRDYSATDFDKINKSRKRDKIQRGRKPIEY